VGLNGWLVPPADIPAMEQAIRNAIETPFLREMGLNAAIEARKKYSMENQISAYTNLYKRMLQEKPRMRIAILTRNLKETALGGIATFYKHLSKGLEELGHG
jgi:hypothetical protein